MRLGFDLSLNLETEFRFMTISWTDKAPNSMTLLQKVKSGDTARGHKAKDITPSITWRREARKEEALEDLP